LERSQRKWRWEENMVVSQTLANFVGQTWATTKCSWGQEIKY
jgi:hypothetical protein